MNLHVQRHILRANGLLNGLTGWRWIAALVCALVAASLLVSSAQAKNPPRSPHGKKGGECHQQAVEQLLVELRKIYPSAEKEWIVQTPGAEKKRRFVDVVARDANGKIVAMYQVGQQTKGKEPIARERRAIRDIEQVIAQHVRFCPYNDPKKTDACLIPKAAACR